MAKLTHKIYNDKLKIYTVSSIISILQNGQNTKKVALERKQNKKHIKNNDSLTQSQ